MKVKDIFAELKRFNPESNFTVDGSDRWNIEGFSASSNVNLNTGMTEVVRKFRGLKIELDDFLLTNKDKSVVEFIETIRTIISKYR